MRPIPQRNVCQPPKPFIESHTKKQEEPGNDDITNNNAIEEVPTTEPNQLDVNMYDGGNLITNAGVSDQDEVFQCRLKLHEEIEKRDQQIHALQLELDNLRFQFSTPPPTTSSLKPLDTSDDENGTNHLDESSQIDPFCHQPSPSDDSSTSPDTTTLADIASLIQGMQRNLEAQGSSLVAPNEALKKSIIL